MTRTLTDMTPAERADCVGMWVKVTPAGGNSPSRTPFLGVLASLDANAYWGKGGYVVRGPHTCAYYFAEMELQPDLPRAWTPDGKPVPGEWEEEIYQDGIGDRVWFTRQRRYITDWEVPHDPR